MNSIAVLAATIFLWSVSVMAEVPASWMLGGLLISIGLRYEAIKNKRYIPSRDPLLIISMVPSFALILYAAMFSVIEVKSYLETSTYEQLVALRVGCNYIFAMLSGGALHLVISRRGGGMQATTTSYRVFNQHLMLLVAWVPIGIAAICYFIYFSGREYVEIHSNVPVIAGILLKMIYLSYPATFFVASSDQIQERKRNRHVAMLFVGHVLVFAVLYMLRSPAIFFSLMVFFLIGHNIPKKVIAIAAFTAPVALSAIALVRDPSLLDGRVDQSVLKLVVTFGDFVDALRFAVDFAASKGLLWGGGILGSLFGFSEPLANLYAKSINEDYFESGGGFGFFILADIFANFGLYFGVLFLTILGFLLSRLATSKFGTTSSYVSCIIFASSVALTRNDLGSTLRGIVYCIFAFLLVQVLTRKQRA